jgi:hypothetical protein
MSSRRSRVTVAPVACSKAVMLAVVRRCTAATPGA